MIPTKGVLNIFRTAVVSVKATLIRPIVIILIINSTIYVNGSSPYLTLITLIILLIIILGLGILGIATQYRSRIAVLLPDWETSVGAARRIAKNLGCGVEGMLWTDKKCNTQNVCTTDPDCGNGTAGGCWIGKIKQCEGVSNVYKCMAEL